MTPRWHELLAAGAGPGAVIAAIVAIFGWWVSRRLERFKHELAGDLAKRQLRADYVRAQIDNLYGPLAFLVEASARHLETSRSVHKAYDGYFDGRPLSPQSEDEMNKTLDIANGYLAFVRENNEQAEKLLRTGWGWLDREDVEIALRFITHVARLDTEFKDGKGQLPVAMYVTGLNRATLEAPSFLPPEFVERISAKLTAKQRQLAGLTGADVNADPMIAAAAAKPALLSPGAPPAPPSHPRPV